jgi:hypothetical protein
MRVQFTYDQEDIVDTTFRVLRRSKTFRALRWQGIILPMLICVGIPVVFFIVLKNPYLAVITAVVSLLTVIALYPSIHDQTIKKRLRKFSKEQFGDRNSFTCEVELTPDVVRFVGDHFQTEYEWTSVDEIAVTEDSVDIFSRLGGMVVRNRAFESPEAREEFIALAGSYFAASRDSTNEEIRSNDA